MVQIVVAYDVSTESKAGSRRLRQVAKACQGFGQRVQDSVFECRLSETDLERLRQRLTGIMDREEDSLRIYRLSGKREEVVEVYGRDLYRDPCAPLIV